MVASRSTRQRRHLEELSCVHPNAAGLDIGSEEIVVAVPAGSDPEPVRVFRTFTSDLHLLVAFLLACGVDTVAMQFTGVYWIPNCKARSSEIEKALTGTWHSAQLFILQQGLELFDFYVVYHLLKTGEPFQEESAEVYEQKRQAREFKNLARRAQKMGYTLTPVSVTAPESPPTAHTQSHF